MSGPSVVCHDCGVQPGCLRHPGCDVERCPNCGHQAISCGCTDEEFGKWPRLKWTGEWPGVVECREFGWYAKLIHGQGWVHSDESDSEAEEDLNRLYTDAGWNPEQARWIKR